MLVRLSLLLECEEKDKRIWMVLLKGIMNYIQKKGMKKFTFF